MRVLQSVLSTPADCCWLVLKSTRAAYSEGNAFHSVVGRAAVYGAKPEPKQAGEALVNTFHCECLFESFHLCL